MLKPKCLPPIAIVGKVRRDFYPQGFLKGKGKRDASKVKCCSAEGERDLKDETNMKATLTFLCLENFKGMIFLVGIE